MSGRDVLPGFEQAHLELLRKLLRQPRPSHEPGDLQTPVLVLTRVPGEVARLDGAWRTWEAFCLLRDWVEDYRAERGWS